MKRTFDIITDSSCDMPARYLYNNAITCAQLGFSLNGEQYGGEDGGYMSEAEFYQRLRDGAMPTTYQVTCEAAKEHIEKKLKQEKDVLVIAFSSGLSGTAGSFQVAARELALSYPERKICVVDSLCASMGQGLLLDYAIQKAESGASIEETVEYLESIKLKICHQFTVDNLFHLKRGGRVSSATALVGTILKIKPVMHMDNEGKLVLIGKTIGRKKALHALVDRVYETADMTDEDPIFISHGDCIHDVEYVQSLLQQKYPKKRILVHYVGTVIGTHSGVGTLAIFHKGTHR